MNHDGICTTYEEVLERGYKEYIKDEVKPGKIIAILKFRAWGKERVLRCFFETNKGEKIILHAWWNRKDGAYTSQYSEIDFSKVKDNTKWKLEIKRNKKGKLYWDRAEQIN